MKKLRITKKQVLKALDTEPLGAGSWISKDPEQGICTVCAVGAVLRLKGQSGSLIERYGNTLLDSLYIVDSSAGIVDIKESLRDKQYLAALSGKFESMLMESNYPTRRQVTALKKWVEKNFPTWFEVYV